MFQAKTIYETLAALTTGAVLLSGCGGAEQPVNAPEVPAAAPEPASAPAGDPAPAKEGATGDSAAGATSEAAPPAAGTPAPSASAAATAAPTGTAAAKAPPKAPNMGKPTQTKAGGAKKGAQGSCGEGTCG